MSLTPHEIESQELACRNAFGHTVIMGLGMGWAAMNAALNPNVTKVTAVELDSRIIDLFYDSGAFDSLPKEAQKKIVIGLLINFKQCIIEGYRDHFILIFREPSGNCRKQITKRFLPES